MEMLVKDGQQLRRYKSNGEVGEGQGANAGTVYRMKDGSLVYVPGKSGP